jgi:hypothetical protein
VLFREDISLELSGHPDLLRKHFPGWVAGGTSLSEVIELILMCQPDDFQYSDSESTFVCRKDVDLRIAMGKLDRDASIREPWTLRFPDRSAIRFPVFVRYRNALARELQFVHVDGGRYYIPLPQSVENLEITKFDYRVGQIINRASLYDNLEQGLRRAEIRVSSSLDFA